MKTLNRNPRRRLLPSIRHINEASEYLPDPDTWLDDTYTVHLPEHEIQIEFERLKFSSREQGRFHRWVYYGRMVV